MAIKFGPFCGGCVGDYAVTDVCAEGFACISCGAPGVVLVDPFDQDWEPEVDEFAESEARWAALFGVVSA